MIDAPPKPRRRLLHYCLVTMLVVVLVIVAGVAWLVCEAVSTSVHAEMALHATNEACDLAKCYVQQHNGTWPRSWHDLEQIKCPPGTLDVFPWPKKSAELQQFVTIDFTANPDRLAKQTTADFEAIKPVGPYFPYKQDGFVASLLESLRASRQTGKAMP